MAIKSINLSSEKGTTLLETSMCVSIIFVFLVFGIDLLRVAYFNAALQYVVSDAGRRGASGLITGTGGATPCTCPATGTSTQCFNEFHNQVAGQGETYRTCCLRRDIQNRLNTLGISDASNNDKDISIYFLDKDDASFKSCIFGTIGDLLVIDAEIPIKLVSPVGALINLNFTNNELVIKASSVSRRETS